jgi:hypothetical protein
MLFIQILAVSFIDGGNQSTVRKPLTCRKSLTNFITLCCIAGVGLELTTLVVIGTDFISNCYSQKYISVNQE